MRILFLDLASHAAAPDAGACAACVAETETAAMRFVDRRIGDDGLIPLIDALLTQAAWTDRDITNVVCVTGPGGFTSLRMAVTLANTLADELNVPLAGVHLSDLYASRVAATDWIWVHSTKKTELFVRGFGAHASSWPEPTLISLDDLAARMPEGVMIAGELLPEHRLALETKKPVDAALTPIADALPSLLKNLAYAQTSIAPWYGRGW